MFKKLAKPFGKRAYSKAQEEGSRSFRRLLHESLEGRAVMDGEVGMEILSTSLLMEPPAEEWMYLTANASDSTEVAALDLTPLASNVAMLPRASTLKLIGSVADHHVIALDGKIVLVESIAAPSHAAELNDPQTMPLSEILFEGVFVDSFLDGTDLTLVTNDLNGQGHVQFFDLASPKSPQSVGKVDLAYPIFQSHQFEHNVFVASLQQPEAVTEVYPAVDSTQWKIEAIDRENLQANERPTMEGPGYLVDWLETEEGVFVVSQFQQSNRLLSSSPDEVWGYVGGTNVSQIVLHTDSVEMKGGIATLSHFVPIDVQSNRDGQLVMIAWDTTSDDPSNAHLTVLEKSRQGYQWSSPESLQTDSTDTWIIHHDFEGVVGLVGTWNSLRLMVPDSTGYRASGVIENTGGVVRWLRIDEQHIAAVAQEFFEYPTLRLDENLQVVADQIPDRILQLHVYDISQPERPILVDSRSIELSEGFANISADDIQWDQEHRTLLIVDRPQLEPSPWYSVASPVDAGSLTSSEGENPASDEEMVATTTSAGPEDRFSILYFVGISEDGTIAIPTTLTLDGEVHEFWVESDRVIALSNQSLTEAAMAAPHSVLSTAILPFVPSFYPTAVGENPFEFPFDYDVPEANETASEIPSDKLLKLLADFGFEDSLDALPAIQIMRPTIRGASMNKFTFAVNGEEWDCDLVDGESVLIRPQQNLFHNPASPTDINADGETTPLDALIVVNILNDRGSYLLPNRVTQASNLWKLDPSGDFRVHSARFVVCL